jgi:hypothetical protein
MLGLRLSISFEEAGTATRYKAGNNLIGLSCNLRPTIEQSNL